MATINGFTKERMLAIQNGVIVAAEIVDGHLVFTRFDESTFDAGQVQGVQGDVGPQGPAGVTPVNPPGAMMAYAGLVIPAGYLICDGLAVSRATYADLYVAIGTAYGAGDGSTTFNLPNIKGRVPTGKDTAQTEFNTLGKTGGEKVHTLLSDEIPSHKHSFQGTTASATGTQLAFHAVPNDSAGVIESEYGPGANVPGNLVGGVLAGGGGGSSHNNLPPYLVLNWIIKT